MVVPVRKHSADSIIVLGVERSGTSVVAEMIHRWGAYAGDQEKLHKADVHAPRGYWEYLPVWDLLLIYPGNLVHSGKHLIQKTLYASSPFLLYSYPSLSTMENSGLRLRRL